MLQVISLIENDDLFENANVSISTDDFFKILKKFTNFWRKFMNEDRAKGQAARWTGLWSVELSEVLTRWGLCYSFNLMNSSKIFQHVSHDFYYKLFVLIEGTTLHGYRTTEDKNATFPLSTPNHEIGFYGEIKKKFGYWWPDEFHRFKNPMDVLDGFHLIFHNFDEYPSTKSIHHYTVSNQSLIFWILPKYTEVDDSLTVMSPEERNCFQNEEKQLKYFKIYNENNCEQECLAEYTLSECDCVQFFMIRK